MSAKPLWLRAVHRVERAVGEPVEAAVRTDTYFEVMTTVTRTTKTAKRTVAGVSTRALHLLNLPAGTDVRRMREQLARMERRINQLSERIEERD
jgi:transcription elongation GreA/GreB family factor